MSNKDQRRTQTTTRDTPEGGEGGGANGVLRSVHRSPEEVHQAKGPHDFGKSDVIVWIALGVREESRGGPNKRQEAHIVEEPQDLERTLSARLRLESESVVLRVGVPLLLSE